MKVDWAGPGRWRRMPLIRSSSVRWKRESISEGPPVPDMVKSEVWKRCWCLRRWPDLLAGTGV
ncbi:hypothetical protein Hanom_Chr16g01454141 [Helianthus anomalus]